MSPLFCGLMCCGCFIAGAIIMALVAMASAISEHQEPDDQVDDRPARFWVVLMNPVTGEIYMEITDRDLAGLVGFYGREFTFPEYPELTGPQITGPLRLCFRPVDNSKIVVKRIPDFPGATP